MTAHSLRELPSVDRIVSDARLNAHAGSRFAAAVARETLADIRTRVGEGAAAPPFEAILEEVAARMDALLSPPLRPLINATGVILHTNLGRAPLAQEALDAMAVASRSYSNLEFDLASGARGSRHDLLEPLICRLTGAEAAMAVNNNAAAVLLTLAALASGKEVIVSRGELVEIGGGFRIPDVMRQSRAKLVEVGTTNRTRASDFDAPISAKTAAIMRVHPSNFQIVGFTEAAPLLDVALLARERGVLLLHDVGSGCLLDTTAYGLPPEPTPQASIRDGADLVLFSGDKLLGGPQAGMIVGKKALIEKLRRHPLARAVRLDKASIAGLAATLRIYLEGAGEEKIPVWRMIALRADAIAVRAIAIASAIGTGASVAEGRSVIGGGSLPEESLPTHLVSLAARRGLNANAIATRLRASGVVARVEGGCALLDPRTVAPEEDAAVVRACIDALA